MLCILCPELKFQKLISVNTSWSGQGLDHYRVDVNDDEVLAAPRVLYEPVGYQNPDNDRISRPVNDRM